MNQRGEIVLAILALTAVLGLGLTATAPAIGRYVAVSQGLSIVRMDTSTGAMERCSLIGNALSCKPVEQASAK